ncbi:MAG: hypothetical protein AB1830_12955 [Pseudomonadota bacterium]
MNSAGNRLAGELHPRLQALEDALKGPGDGAVHRFPGPGKLSVKIEIAAHGSTLMPARVHLP